MRISTFIVAALYCAVALCPGTAAAAVTESKSSASSATVKKASSPSSPAASTRRTASVPSTDKYRRNTVPKPKPLTRRRILMETSAFGFSHAFIIFRSWLITLLAIRVAVLFSVSTWRQVKKALSEMDDTDFQMPFLHVEVKSRASHSVSTMSSNTTISEQDSMNSFLKNLTNGDDQSVTSLPISKSGSSRHRFEPKKPRVAPKKKAIKSYLSSMNDDDQSLDSFIKILDDEESTVDTQPITSSDGTSRKGMKKHNPDKVIRKKKKSDEDGLTKAKVKDILSQYGLGDDSDEDDDSCESSESEESQENSESSDLIKKASSSSRRKPNKAEKKHKMDVAYGNDDENDIKSNASFNSDALFFPTSAIPA